MTQEIRTRFAPSPTGDLHIGGVRTALFNWAYAKKLMGKFILRIEDSDSARSNQKFSEGIMEGLTWLGISFDEGPIYQSDRLDRYSDEVEKLLSTGHAYRCYCSKDSLAKMRAIQIQRGEKPRYNGRCRPENIINNPLNDVRGVPPVIRFRNPVSGYVKWKDGVRGLLSVNNTELDDLILLRSDGTPTYNLTVVVDDIDMNISHVIRGDDHINNTPKQINIFHALGVSLPNYVHLPMIHGQDGEKLSKRHGAISILEYKKNGFIPEAMINYLAKLGWGYKDAEIFSRDEFVKMFSLADCSLSPSRFDLNKLLWVNNNHLKNISIKNLKTQVLSALKDEDYYLDERIDVNRLCMLLKNRANTVKEIIMECKNFYRPKQFYSLAEINNSEALRKFKFDKIEFLETVLTDFLASVPDDFSIEQIQISFKKVLAQYNLKMPQLGVPLRLILLGSPKSPALEEVLLVLGRKIVFERINECLESK
tara:strand:+ start:6101 stop:7537 length:1437 start_codon:yes stop_codon:yes gene_type:complete